MLASRTNSTHNRRARSAEDESPVIVASIAILAAIVLSCAGMMAPLLWDAFVGGTEPHGSAPGCSQRTGPIGATICPNDARLQGFQPRPNAKIDPLIPHL
jgi:hypothetical protein